jgi:hypothetical protein
MSECVDRALNGQAAAACDAEHLTPLTGGGWRFWREAGLRSAGFASAMVLPFADVACTEAARALNDAEEAVQAQWRALLEELRPAIEEVRGQLANTHRGDEAHAGTRERRDLLRRAARCVYGRRIGPELGACASPVRLGALAEARRARDAAAISYGLAYSSASQSSAKHAHSLAGNQRFRDAIAWQNVEVIESVLDWMRDSADPSESRWRAAESLIANYAQRYAVKNDTIGFFGPMGWTRFVDAPNGLDCAPGPSLISRRTVHMEHWAVRAFAARLTSDLALSPWIAPLLAPQLRIEGERLWLPGSTFLVLPPVEAAVLALCDGTRLNDDIVKKLAEDEVLRISDADARRVLARQATVRRVVMEFEVRAGDPFAMDHLRGQLERIGDPAVRARALARHRTLEDALDAVRSAADDGTSLPAAQRRLAAQFAAEASTPSTRNAGETYGARTVAYQDCMRDVTVTFGSDLRQDLQAPLELVLTSARWLCDAIGRRMLAALRRIFEELSASRLGSRGVDFPTFWFSAQELFFGETSLGIDDLSERLHGTWRSLLDIPPHARVVQRSSAELKTAVADLFAASGCGWPSACHQSPDVMICADSANAVARGDYQFVLGELHMGFNSLLNTASLQQHPEPATLLAWLHRDLGAARCMPLLSPEAKGQPVRVQRPADSHVDTELRFAVNAHGLTGTKALSIGSLVVNDTDAGLVVQALDGDPRPDLPIAVALGELFSAFAVNRFDLFDDALHTPRVCIDKLVVQRETWRVTPTELAIAALARNDAEGLRLLGSWARERGMPRWMFVRMPWEKKPVYLDLASPAFVRILLKQVRGAYRRDQDKESLMTFGEMLPAHGQHWLADAAGTRFCSELRIVAIHADDSHGTHP